MTDIWSNGWGEPAAAINRVVMHFARSKKKALHNFSAGTRIGESLFLAADEHAAIDRLTQLPDGGWGSHEQYKLRDLLPLAEADQEADIEGLSEDGGWLWVLGSHARTRPKAEKAEGERIDLNVLADLKDTRSRCLLARLPLVNHSGVYDPVRMDGQRRAGMLPQDHQGNALAAALAQDSRLAPFTRIPAKEGGIDIEGIAVSGSRVALGMRGPVIGGHGLIVEIEIEITDQGDLSLAGEPIRRLIALEGLGVRDLKRHGDDLLILAGPTTALSGPCALYRWKNWVTDLPIDPATVSLHRPGRLLEIPFGRGSDHPEGLALWALEDETTGLMVIYDSPADHRIDVDAKTVIADIFRLP